MFKRITVRALEVAEEQFRRIVFENNMRPEAADLVRDQVVEEMADQYIDRLAERASEYLDRKRRPA
jgi:hypothetical protein